MTTDTKTKTRWRAVAWYRTDAGPLDVEHHLDEIEELAEIVERGPSFGALEKVEIFYNWGRGQTIEQCDGEDRKQPGDTCATCTSFDKHDGEAEPRCWYGVPATPDHWCLEFSAKIEAE
jgi:hypothetical protein